jgi:hypothetical protein
VGGRVSSAVADYAECSGLCTCTVACLPVSSGRRAGQGQWWRKTWMEPVWDLSAARAAPV